MPVPLPPLLLHAATAGEPPPLLGGGLGWGGGWGTSGAGSVGGSSTASWQPYDAASWEVAGSAAGGGGAGGSSALQNGARWPVAAAAVAAVVSPRREGQLALPGLRTETGEYNCFLNAVVQCVWHCAAFRQQVGPGLKLQVGVRTGAPAV